MIVRQIVEGTRDFKTFKKIFRSHLGVAYGQTEREPEKTLLFGWYDQNELMAFAQFQPYTDPGLHIGNTIALEQFHRMTCEDTAIFVIRLIYSFKGNHILKASAEALISGCEDYLLETFREYCLMISLYDNANEKAFPLYSELGFKKKDGTESYAMAIDIFAFLNNYVYGKPLKENIVFKSLDHLSVEEFYGLVDCYRDIFTPQLPFQFVAAQLKGFLTGQILLKGLSAIIIDKAAHETVVGFCWIARHQKKSIYINAFGIAKNYRKGFTAAELFYPIMKKCNEMGYEKAKFSTGSARLKNAFQRILGATLEDIVCWHIKCNVSDA